MITQYASYHRSYYILLLLFITCFSTVAFSQEIALTVVKEGKGNGEVTFNAETAPLTTECNEDETSCIYTFPTNTSVTLTVVAGAESFVDAWKGTSPQCADNSQVNADKTTATTKILLVNDATCTASIGLVSHQFTFATSGTGQGNVVIQPKGTDCGVFCFAYESGTELTLTAAPIFGSQFSGWEDACQEGEAEMMLVLDADKKCTATFKTVPIYQLSLTATGGQVIPKPTGVSCGTDCYRYELTDPPTTVALNPTADAGFFFTGWSGGDDCNDGKVTLDQDKQCSALFDTTPPFYTVTVTQAGDGNGTFLFEPLGEPCTGSEASLCTSYLATSPPSILTITAQPAEGSQFIGWQGDCNTEGQVLLNMSQQCTATFTLLPPVTLLLHQRGTGNGQIIVNPVGNICEPPTSTSTQVTSCYHYQTGTSVTFEAVTAEGSVFKGWENDCATSANLDLHSALLMDRDKACAALFDLIPVYRLTTSTTPSGGQVLVEPLGKNCGAECNAYLLTEPPAPVTLTPQLPTNATFTNWQGPSDCLDGQVTIDANKHCIATFTSPGTLQFTAPTYEVAENLVDVKVAVSRVSGSQGVVSVAYTTQAGTATEGNDYQTTQGTLTWADGEVIDKTITIPIVYDKLSETMETFTVALATPTGGALLATQTTAVNILDNVWVPSLIEFAESSYKVGERERQLTVTVKRSANLIANVSVHYITEADTATAAVDFHPLKGTLTFATGESEKTIMLQVMVDDLEEETETVRLLLQQPSDEAVLGEKRTATINIQNTLPVGNLQFETAEYSFGEGTEAQIPVIRQDGSAGAITVSYESRGITAQEGVDYRAANGVLRWKEGETEPRFIRLILHQDTAVETTEQLTLTLLSPTGYSGLGTPVTTTIHILDRPRTALNSTITLEQSEYMAVENQTIVTFTATRSGGTAGIVTATYVTEDNSAFAGQDYFAAQGQLSWKEGELGAQQFTINLINDSASESDEYFTVQLTDLTGAARLSTPAQATVHIEDDDATHIRFSSIGYVVAENSLKAIVPVVRSGNPSEIVSVNHATIEGSAKMGADFEAVNGTLTWYAGETGAKNITVPLLYDKIGEGREEFYLQLSDLQGNAFLSKPDWTTVVIDDNREECPIVDQTIDCFYQNNGVLQNIRITERGILTGGELQGTFYNKGTIRGVTLHPQSRIIGGIVSGEIVGIPTTANNLPLLSDVTIVTPAQLRHVLIDEGVLIDKAVSLQEGVRFINNNAVPPLLKLNDILGYVATPSTQRAINLSSDVLLLSGSGGILTTLNGLPALANQHLVLEQVEGYLTVLIGNERCMAIPKQVQQVMRQQIDQSIPLGVELKVDETVVFITHTGREVTAHPVTQESTLLRSQLAQWGLTALSVQENGTLKIPLLSTVEANEPSYFYARPSLCAQEVPANTPLGFSDTLPVSLVFVGNEGTRRRQLFYPAPLAELMTQESNISLKRYGQVILPTASGSRPGVFDYLITTGGEGTIANHTYISEVEDINQDGLADYRLLYPTGEQQWVLGIFE